MTGKTHIYGGMAVAATLCGDLTSACWLMVGALLPDIDHGGSMLGRTVPFFSWFLKHRGLTHSLLFCVGMFFLNKWLCIGCVTHIVLDMMTKGGVNLFWPLGLNVRFPLACFIKTGGLFEKLLGVILIMYVVAMLAINYFGFDIFQIKI